MAKTTIVARPTPSQISSEPKSSADSVTLTIDAVLREQHDLSSTITDHPVEEGVDISDHSRPDPDRFTFECVVSNTPITSQQQSTSDTSGTSTPQSGGGSTKPRRDPARASHAYEQLKSFRDNGNQLTITTSLRLYTSMVLERLSVPREAKNSDALEFSATFKFVRIAKNKLTKNVVAKDPRAQKKKSTGSTTPKEGEKEKSNLAKGLDGAKGENGIAGKAGGFIGGVLGF